MIGAGVWDAWIPNLWWSGISCFLPASWLGRACPSHRWHDKNFLRLPIRILDTSKLAFVQYRQRCRGLRPAVQPSRERQDEQTQSRGASVKDFFIYLKNIIPSAPRTTSIWWWRRLRYARPIIAGTTCFPGTYPWMRQGLWGICCSEPNPTQTEPNPT